MKATKQKDKAKKLSMSPGQLSRVLSGKRNLGASKAKQVSKMTSSPLEIWLFNTKKNISARKKALGRLAA